MKNRKKFQSYFFLIFALLNLIYVFPSHALNAREDFFRNALELSSSGNFQLALEKWDSYLKFYPDDAAALSNRGNETSGR